MKKNSKKESFDPRIMELIPHRPPMLLINRIVSVSENSACAEVEISDQSSFYTPNLGVPTWIGLEHMGQTAALMAGYQQEKGIVERHLGFLLGSRKFRCTSEWIAPGSLLRVSCEQIAIVGGSLANFQCTITNKRDDSLVAEATLSVLRKKAQD